MSKTAVEIQPAQSLSLQQYIARVQIERGANLIVHFEDGMYDDGGNLVGCPTFGSRVVQRNLTDIGSDSQTIDGVTVTMDQVMAFLNAFIYSYRETDQAAETVMKPMLVK